ncbi:DUF4157 domain-containing protein, partial [Streptomyces sp. NPDC002138]|uniref:eCIS core domain-containing protein n=1 Tax=Streptomyces sp. NPDC002138 TaxID=3154410 RepID=UPI003326902A
MDSSAYTVGRDLVFAAGRYAPHTRDGRRLLAHELAHVAQQSSVGALSPGRPFLHCRSGSRPQWRNGRRRRAPPARVMCGVPQGPGRRRRRRPSRCRRGGRCCGVRGSHRPRQRRWLPGPQRGTLLSACPSGGRRRRPRVTVRGARRPVQSPTAVKSSLSIGNQRRSDDDSWWGRAPGTQVPGADESGADESGT